MEYAVDKVYLSEQAQLLRRKINRRTNRSHFFRYALLGISLGIATFKVGDSEAHSDSHEAISSAAGFITGASLLSAAAEPVFTRRSIRKSVGDFAEKRNSSNPEDSFDSPVITAFLSASSAFSNVLPPLLISNVLETGGITPAVIILGPKVIANVWLAEELTHKTRTSALQQIIDIDFGNAPRVH